VKESTAFERSCAELEQATSFDARSARGTVRLALKEAGLDSREVTSAQMIVVVKRVLPLELKRRGVKDADQVCSAIAGQLDVLAPSSPVAGSSAEDVFRRLGGS
jgi:hypothetical protein